MRGISGLAVTKAFIVWRNANWPRVATGRAARVECLLLDEQDGLLGGQTYSGSQPSACKTPDGRLWFATPHGLAMLDPAHISRRDSQPKVFIERLRVGDAWLELLDEPGGAIKGARSSGRESAHSSLQRSQSRLTSAATLQGSKVQLSAGSGRSLAFEFTALEYFAPKKLRFRYRLEGFDRDWHDAGVRRTAFYTNLKPGDYRFQVIAANRNGVWNGFRGLFALHPRPISGSGGGSIPAWLFAAALAGFLAFIVGEFGRSQPARNSKRRRGWRSNGRCWAQTSTMRRAPACAKSCASANRLKALPATTVLPPSPHRRAKL